MAEQMAGWGKWHLTVARLLGSVDPKVHAEPHCCWAAGCHSDGGSGAMLSPAWVLMKLSGSQIQSCPLCHHMHAQPSRQMARRLFSAHSERILFLRTV